MTNNRGKSFDNDSSSTLEDKNKFHAIEWNSNSPVKG